MLTLNQRLCVAVDHDEIGNRPESYLSEDDRHLTGGDAQDSREELHLAGPDPKLTDGRLRRMLGKRSERIKLLTS